MTTRVEHEVVIPRPVEEVFAYVVDPANVPDWQPAVVEMRAVGPIGAGQRVIQTRRLAGRRIDLVVDVIEYVENERFGLRIASGPAPGVMTATFSEVQEGTRVRMVAEIPGGGLRRLANAVLGEAARLELAANGQRLKRILSSEGPEILEADPPRGDAEGA